MSKTSSLRSDKRLSDMVEYAGSYLAGQVGEDTADMKGRPQHLRQIDKLLARGGSDKSKILSAVVYVPTCA